MKIEEKAQELVDKFYPFVNGYIGSSMLTNTEYPEAILHNARKGAIVAADEMLNELSNMELNYDLNLQKDLDYWKEVKTAIGNTK